jgi:hypothetical protein
MRMSLLEILRTIPDHRRARGKRFDLATVLLYAILGMGRRRQLVPANA